MRLSGAWTARRLGVKTWRDNVSPQFRQAAEALLRKSRGNLYRVKRACANRWIDLKIIESGVELRGRAR